MKFKKFFENIQDIEETLNSLPKKHLDLLNGFKLRYTCNNTLDKSKDYIGVLKNSSITVSAPWNYSRQFTTLHEFAHLVWCKSLSQEQKKIWKKIFNKEKSKMDHPSVKQNAEEIFCMCYANYYSKHKLLTYENKVWNNFIKNL